MKNEQQTDASRQEEEIQALKAIYDDVFIESPQEKAWKVGRPCRMPKIELMLLIGNSCIE